MLTSTDVGWEIFVPWRPRWLCPLIYAAGHRREGVTLHQDWKKSHSMVGIYILVPIFIIQLAVDEKNPLNGQRVGLYLTALSVPL